MTEQERIPDAEVEQAAHAWLVALREQEAMPDDSRTRIWERLEASIAGDEPAQPTEALPPRSLGHWWIAASLAFAAFVAFLVYQIDVGAIFETSQRDDASQAVYTHPSEPGKGIVKHGRLIPQASGQKPKEVQVQVKPSRRAQSPDARPPKLATPPPAKTLVADPSSPVEQLPAGSLAAETRALAGARQALAAGEPGRALKLLDRSARAFPQGQLLEERKALRAIALCEVGNDIQGRGEARAFVRNFSDSALGPRVRQACGLDGE